LDSEENRIRISRALDFRDNTRDMTRLFVHETGFGVNEFLDNFENVGWLHLEVDKISLLPSLVPLPGHRL
jgi:hypothetical protein